MRFQKQHKKKQDQLDRLVCHYPGIIFKAKRKGGQYIHTLFGGELLERTGCAAHDVIGKGLHELLPASVAQQLTRYYDAAWMGESITYLLPIEGFVLQTYLRPVLQGRVTVELIGYCVDITERQKTEEELRTAKLYLESFIEHTPDAISIRPINSDILFVNKAFERLFEVTFEEYQQNWRIIIPSEEIYQESLTKHRLVLTEGKPVEYETYRKRKDGSLINVQITYTPIRGADGNMIGTAGIVRDITDRKQYESAVRESEAKYRIVAENTSDIISIIDLTGALIYISPSVEANLGFSPRECIGRSILDLLHPDDVCSILRSSLALKSGKQSMQIEKRIQHKLGHYVHFESRGVPVFNKHGQVETIVSVSRNITERKVAEEAIRQSEEKYRLIAENTMDIIRILDKEKVVRYASPSHEAILGYKPREIEGTCHCEHTHPDDLDKLMQTYSQVTLTKRPETIEYRYLHKKGHYLILEAHGIPLLDADSEVTGYMMIGRDITERKRSEEIIRETEKLSVIGELAAGIAHEIRNPLTSLKGFIQLLNAGSQENKHYYQIMEAELDRINYIVSELLVLSKPQVLHYKDKNINEIIESVITLLETQAILNNVQIQTAINRSLPPVKCEENQIKQVFINLLKNGIEASPQGGFIFIKTDLLEDDKVLIRFIDHGNGIPAELIAKLGEPFYTTKEKGTGLGLMVSNKIIKDHRGSISITSQLGRGTTVDVILPLKASGVSG